MSVVNFHQSRCADKRCKCENDDKLRLYINEYMNMLSLGLTKLTNSLSFHLSWTPLSLMKCIVHAHGLWLINNTIDDGTVLYLLYGTTTVPFPTPALSRRIIKLYCMSHVSVCLWLYVPGTVSLFALLLFLVSPFFLEHSKEGKRSVWNTETPPKTTRNGSKTP